MISEYWSGPDDKSAIAFWKIGCGRCSIKLATRVWLRVYRGAAADEVILRSILLQDSICSDLLILSQPSGPSYPLSSEYTERLAALLARRPDLMPAGHTDDDASIVVEARTT